MRSVTDNPNSFAKVIKSCILKPPKRSLNNYYNIDSARQFQTLQNDAIREIEGEAKFSGYAVPQDLGVDCISGWGAQPTGAFSSSTGVTGNSYCDQRKIVFKASIVVPTSSENRPYNANEKRYVKI